VAAEEPVPHELVRDFMVALIENRTKAETMLTEHAALLNARGMNDETALHYLAIEGYADAVRFLASRGADIDAVNMFGDTALVDVAGLGRTEIADILLEHGADPNARTRWRDNPLHAAARQGHVELVDHLLGARADGDYRTDNGETVFDAVRENPADVQNALIVVLATHGLREPPRPALDSDDTPG
jgi:ankyrin repeat protein